MKQNIFCVLAVALTLFSCEIAALTKPISFGSTSQINGKIIGPISSGEFGSEVKAYYLQPEHPLSLNDPNSSCGPQEIDSLPILAEGLGKYKGKKVTVTVSIRCIESKLGSYAIERVHSIKAVR